MKLSIITPTHNPQFLVDVYQSLQLQDHGDWEWLIGLNGGASLPNVDAFYKDSRVKPFNLRVNQANVGALKFACSQRAAGEVLVELDHDDQLVPGVLTKIAEKIDEGADFVYSDAACYDDENNRPVWYGEAHGWETYPFNVYGQELIATRNFPITPRSLCEVYYSPDHVRCWRREFYDRIGGHDVTLSVCDDHDLVCRSYLSGGKFAHTGTAGYIYRYHKGNTVKERNAQIQQQTASNRQRYLHKLIDEWIRRENLKFVDMQNDVEWMDNLPVLSEFRTNSVGCIRAYDVLSYIPKSKVPQVFEEMFRILAAGGWLCVRVYSTNGPGGFLPSSNSYWNTMSFDYFSVKEKANEIQPYRGRYQQVQCYESFIDDNRRRYNAISVYADLCAIKSQRQPGLVLI